MDSETLAAVPVKTAALSVLIDSDQTLQSAPTAPAAYTLRGSTANFDVSFDSSLGASGQALANAVLAQCEQDLAQLRGWFGALNTGRFSVFIDPGTFGAYHASCPATGIHCAAFGGNDGALENFLNVAELSEVFMAVQGAGWNCGASAGEGLSRVLAFEAHPASQWLPENRAKFITAPVWLNSARPDWVTQTEGTDRDKVSIGCATLFLNYLRHQLHFTLEQIVQAGGTTLQQTWQRLTVPSNAPPLLLSSQPFGPFAALLAAYFPPGVTVDLPGDNPFPLSRVPSVVFDPATAAAREVERAGLVPQFTGASQSNSYVNSQKPPAGQVVPGGSIVHMRLVAGPTP